MQDVAEREASFEVPAGWSLPDLAAVTPEGGSVEARTDELSATYFDTSEATLASLGVTLRRRTGGEDAGWHLKLPTPAAGTGINRTEVRSRSRQTTIPKALTEAIGGLLRGLPLHEVATITTTRHATVVRDATDEVVVEIAEDHVRGATLADHDAGHEAGVAEWHEVEVEAGPGSQDASFATFVTLLTDSGAELSADQVKLVRLLRAVGRTVPTAGPDRDRLTGYVREQATTVLLGEVDVRRGSGRSAVHKTRVAVRRLRSTLRLFDSLLDTDRLDPHGTLDDDLRWFAGLLGAVRDLDVLQDYVDRAVAGLPAELVVGPVQRQLSEEISAQRQVALRDWRRAWGEDRYARVMGALETLSRSLPLAGPGLKQKAWKKAAAAIVQDADQKLAKRVRRAGDDVGAVHRARKAAKRLRYATDLVGPDVKQARKIGKAAKVTQKQLGEHQDRVVAAAFLREQGIRAGAQPDYNGFTYGLLAERADTEARDLRRALAS